MGKSLCRTLYVALEDGWVHRWRIVWKCGCRSTHFAIVHPQKLMKHPWRTSDTVLVVRHGCSIYFCGCTTAKWVLRHPHFHTILHLWLGVWPYRCYFPGRHLISTLWATWRRAVHRSSWQQRSVPDNRHAFEDRGRAVAADFTHQIAAAAVVDDVGRLCTVRRGE